MKKILLCFLVLATAFSCKKEQQKSTNVFENTKLSGVVFGTSYAVIYDTEIDYTQQFDSLFKVINTSMSTYIPDSDISKVNRNEAVNVDEHFTKVLFKSQEVFTKTNGVFDPTIGAVVNAWNFGPKKKVIHLDSLKIDKVMQSVGLNKVVLITDGEKKSIKKPEDTFLDFNAIAKGYGVDVIAEFLERNGATNYLVEIGGEIRVKGKNKEKNKPWRVGIDTPRFDGGQSVFKVVNLINEAMATSGTYRKFKVDDNGNKYAHIINTKTGYPTKTNILSVSVIAKDCMTADAYATAFQAMGIDGVASFLKIHPELKSFLIFENKNNELETLALNGFPEKK